MTATEKMRLKLLRVAGAAVFSVYKGVLYFLSFLGPVFLIYQWRLLPVTILLALAIIGFGFAGSVFLLVLVLTKKYLIGPVQPTGLQTIHTREGKKWFLAAMLT